MHILRAECCACKHACNWFLPEDVKVDQTRRGEVLCRCVHVTALYAKHRRLHRAYYTDGRERNFSNDTCLWVTHTLGKLQHALLGAGLESAVCLMISAWCLLVPWSCLGKGEHWLKGWPWKWGYPMRPSPLPLNPHSRHAFPHFLPETNCTGLDVNVSYVTCFQIVLFLWSVLWEGARRSGLQMQV